MWWLLLLLIPQSWGAIVLSSWRRPGLGQSERCQEPFFVSSPVF